MPRPFIVFDIETTLDKEAAARAFKVCPEDAEALKAAVGDFPKTPFHRIVAIAATTLTYDAFYKRWSVREMATLHTNGGDDGDLVRQFLQYLHGTAPIVVSYNGGTFDLPVVRARAMLHRISAPALASEPFRPFSRDHLDLCDLFWGRGRDRMTLDQSARVFGVGAKTQGIDGSKVDEFADAGRFDTIAAYCLDDVVITTGMFLLYQAWQGIFAIDGLENAMTSLRQVRDHIVATKPTVFVRDSPMPLVPEL